MHKLFTLLFLTLLTGTLIAQTEDVATGLGRPYELLLFGDDLIISEITTDRISRIDLTDPAYPRTTFVNGIDNPLGMSRDGSTLFVAGRNDSIIYRVNLMAPEPTLSEVIKIDEKPLGVAFHDGHLYIGTLFTHKIYRVDLSMGPFVAEDLGFAGLGQPGFMVTHGDYVYFSDVNDDLVMRFDATLADPVLETVATGIDSPAGMFFDGDYLYVNGYLSQAVFRIDVTGGFPAPAVEVLELDNPRGLILYEEEFFSTLYVENKIVKGAFSLLPVTWESFIAQVEENKAVNLSWSVSAIENHDFFSVERSADGTNWTVLPNLVVIADSFSGEAAGAREGFWSKDPEPLSGTSYYRIRQTDFDGASSLSKVATATLGPTDFTVYPNPVSHQAPLTVSGLEDGRLVQLFNAAGRLVRQSITGPDFSLKGLTPGVYVLRAGDRARRVVVW
jgi:hypothetical protein